MKLNGLVTGIGVALMMAAVRPAAAQITITVGDATAAQGGTATFAVTLDGVTAGGVPANNAQLDIIFDTTVFEPLADAAAATAACTIDPRLASLTHTETVPTSPAVPAGMQRLRLNIIDTGAVLGLVTDGALYSCTFQVSPTAATGPTTLQATRQNVGDESGNTLTSQVANGTVTITGNIVEPTATPCPSGIVVAVGGGNATADSPFTFAVTLSGVAAGGTPANNAQVDIIFDTTFFAQLADAAAATAACTIDPRLASLTHTETVPTSPAVPAGMQRLRLNIIDTGAVLGLVTDGALYSCTFQVNPDATGSTTLQATRQNVGDESGNTLPSSVCSGDVMIGGVILPTSTPTNTPIPPATDTPTVPPTSTATTVPPTSTATTKPTSTATSPPAPTSSFQDEDGCQIGAPVSGNGFWLLLVPAVGLLVMRRRRR